MLTLEQEANLEAVDDRFFELEEKTVACVAECISRHPAEFELMRR